MLADNIFLAIATSACLSVCLSGLKFFEVPACPLPSAQPISDTFALQGGPLIQSNKFSCNLPQCFAIQYNLLQINAILELYCIMSSNTSPKQNEAKMLDEDCAGRVLSLTGGLVWIMQRGTRGVAAL